VPRWIPSALVSAGILAGIASIAVGSVWTLGVDATNHGLARSGSRPDAPTSPTTSCVSSTSTSVRIDWQERSPVTSYAILASTSGPRGTYLLHASDITASPYTTGTLPPGTYYFKIVAHLGAHWSSVRSVVTSPARIISTTMPECS
jgi:hypothetical protein